MKGPLLACIIVPNQTAKLLTTHRTSCPRRSASGIGALARHQNSCRAGTCPTPHKSHRVITGAKGPTYTISIARPGTQRVLGARQVMRSGDPGQVSGSGTDDDSGSWWEWSGSQVGHQRGPGRPQRAFAEPDYRLKCVTDHASDRPSIASAQCFVEAEGIDLSVEVGDHADERWVHCDTEPAGASHVGCTTSKDSPNACVE